jgi:aspartokinase
MLKVSSAVEEIVRTSEFASEGLSNGCLNLSAYAKSILPLVEAKTKKDVTLGSIIAALSRMSSSSSAKNHKPFIPEVEAYNLLTRSGLAEITYVKTPQNQQLVSKLYADTKFTNSQFFVVTAGLGEISIITTEELADEIKELFAPQQPKLFMKNLASLSMQTADNSIETPNQFYAIIKQLALQRINIVEFVTTYTELSFILDQADLKQAFNLLHDSFFVHKS